MKCPTCYGQGFHWEPKISIPPVSTWWGEGGYSKMDFQWVECKDCNGTGEIQDESKPEGG